MKRNADHLRSNRGFEVKMHARYLGAIVACAAIVMTTTTTAGAADEGLVNRSDVRGWGVVANGEYTAGVEIEALFPGAANDDDVVSPLLLDPVDLVACNILDQTGHEIRRIDDVKYFSSFAGGSVSLTCGNSDYGYRHIRDGHETDWRNILLKVDDYSNWDDFMYWVALQSLLSPERITDKGNGKLCYTTPITLMDFDMAPVYTFKPTIIISSNNRHVITAYPGGGC